MGWGGSSPSTPLRLYRPCACARRVRSDWSNDRSVSVISSATPSAKSPVTGEVELGFQGPVDRFDHLGTAAGTLV